MRNSFRHSAKLPRASSWVAKAFAQRPGSCWYESQLRVRFWRSSLGQVANLRLCSPLMQLETREHGVNLIIIIIIIHNEIYTCDNVQIHACRCKHTNVYFCIVGTTARSRTCYYTRTHTYRHAITNTRAHTDTHMITHNTHIYTHVIIRHKHTLIHIL